MSCSWPGLCWVHAQRRRSAVLVRHVASCAHRSTSKVLHGSRGRGKRLHDQTRRGRAGTPRAASLLPGLPRPVVPYGMLYVSRPPSQFGSSKEMMGIPCFTLLSSYHVAEIGDQTSRVKSGRRGLPPFVDSQRPKFFRSLMKRSHWSEARLASLRVGQAA